MPQLLLIYIFGLSALCFGRRTLLEYLVAFEIRALILPRYQTEKDQGSDFNVISTGLATKLGLQLQSLDLVRLRGLTIKMQITKTRNYTTGSLEVGVQGIRREIRCFVSPEITRPPTRPNPPSLTTTDEPLSLLLGISWLYSVNTQLSIRNSVEILVLGKQSVR